MNFKLRLQNKTTLLAILTAIVACGYQVAGIVGVVPAISQDEVVQAVGFFINLLVILGVCVDPTTPGVGDSTTALNRLDIYEAYEDDKIIERAKHAKVEE